MREVMRIVERERPSLMMREWIDLRWFGEGNGEDLRSLERAYSGRLAEAAAAMA